MFHFLYRDSPPVVEISTINLPQPQSLDLRHELAYPRLIIAASDQSGGRSVDDEQPLNAEGSDEVIGAGLHNAVSGLDADMRAANRVALLGGVARTQL